MQSAMNVLHYDHYVGLHIRREHMENGQPATLSNRDDAERLILYRTLQSEVAHDLSSPARGIAILSDLLCELLERKELDLDSLEEISRQLAALSVDLNQRLEDFAQKDGI